MRLGVFLTFVAPLLILGLSRCTTVVPGPGCPSLVQYDAATQARAAAELRYLEETGVAPTLVDTFIPDYGRLRDQVRACRGE